MEADHITPVERSDSLVLSASLSSCSTANSLEPDVISGENSSDYQKTWNWAYQGIEIEISQFPPLLRLFRDLTQLTPDCSSLRCHKCDELITVNHTHQSEDDLSNPDMPDSLYSSELLEELSRG